MRNLKIRNTLFITAAILTAVWTIGFFGYNTGVALHFLLLLAAVAVIMGVTSETEQI